MPNSMMGLKEFTDKVGDDIHRSGLCGTKNNFQGRIIAMHCVTCRHPLLSIPQEYHVLGDKLSLKAEAMLARVRQAGGDHDVVERTPDAAEIKIYYKGKTLTGRLTWEEAQQETFVYAGKDKEVVVELSKGKKPALKTAYATPHRRMQQLWARVVSDTVRAIAPELIAGRYTPNEIADFSGVSLPESPIEEMKQRWKDRIGAAAAAASEKLKDEDPSSEDGQISGTDALLDRVMKLLDSVGVDEDARQNILAKREVESFVQLNDDQLQELIAKLEAIEEQQFQQTESQPSSQSTSQQPAQEDPPVVVDGPIPDHLQAAIRAKLSALAQTGQAGIEVCNRVKEKLQACGLKLADLSLRDGESLLNALDNREAELFFGASLRPYSGGTGEGSEGKAA